MVGSTPWCKCGPMSDDAITSHDHGTAPSERTRLRRGAHHGTHDPSVIRSIIDAAAMCHVAVVTASGPMALPMAHGRIGDVLYLHGALANSVLGAGVGAQMSVTFTELDGLVIARSAFHNSMNYRCVVVFGAGRRVEGEEAIEGLRAVADHVVPTWDAGRPPSEAEIRRTLVVALPMSETSAKIRSGDPIDELEDINGPWWAGTVPLDRGWGRPIPSADLPAGIAVPDPVAQLGR